MTPGLEKALITKDYSLTLENARLYKNQMRLELTVKSDSLLTPKQIRAAEENITALTPADITIELIILYPQSTKCIKEDFASASSIIREVLCDMFPACAPVIDITSWSLEDDSIVITVPERLMWVLNEPVRFIKSTYMPELNVQVSAGECNDVKPVERRIDSAPVPEVLPEKPKKAKLYSCVFGSEIADDAKLTPIAEIKKEMRSVTFRGYIVPMTEDELKRGDTDHFRRIVADSESAITLYINLRKNAEKKNIVSVMKAAEKAGNDVIVRGKAYIDSYSNELHVMPYDISVSKPILRKDSAESKRVELHLHTTMSEMDALTKPAEAIKLAAAFGHKAIAITDHGVAHAFPDAMLVADKVGIKLLFGVEGYLQDDSEPAPLSEFNTHNLVSVALTTTSVLSETHIFEIAAHKIGTDEEFYRIVNPGIPLPKDIVLACGDADVHTFEPLSDVITEFVDFLGDDYRIITHDREALCALCLFARHTETKLDERYVDTKLLSHYANTHSECESIADALKAFGVNDIECNDVISRARLTSRLYSELTKELDGSSLLPVQHTSVVQKHKKDNKLPYYHIILIAKTREGLKNLYKMVSYSHCENFHKRPLIPRSLFSFRREGVMLGSACERGELFRAVISDSASAEVEERIASWYDFLEIQPICNNAFMLRNGTATSEDQLRDFNRRIVELGDKLGLPVVATGDVHFLNPEDGVFRKVLLSAMHFSDTEEQAPLYFKTTDEMLSEFSYLGEEKAFEVVVTNTNKIADCCDSLRAYLDKEETYAPVFDGAEDELRNSSVKRVHEIYGEQLPEPVEKRLKFELDSIINNGYATLYLMAQRLVKKSMSDGYLVGSRGSVGSSFVAFLLGITEVNPLIAHYVCPKCTNSEFDNPDFPCGVDMPSKQCPVCGETYMRTGFDIPFEVFLGFKGDKTPDIDLNFSGEYQWRAHDYTRVMFGEGHSYRAGTISALKDKTAFGYVRAYAEQQGLMLTAAQSQRLAMGCVGVKKTTGQHAGGMVIIPDGYEAEDFLPLQYPANKKEGNHITTHFDFHAMHDKLVKLDILGHDDPTALKMLKDMTGFDPQNVPLEDEQTMGLFSSAEPLHVDLSELGCDVGALGIPEFGTTFVRKILSETRPTTIEELVRIAGLSHGTNVWTDNAQKLVSEGKATLSQVICTRDDIMLFLISVGCEPSMAFKIMESVRKGRGLNADMEAAMNKLKLPPWYIDSCKKIEYMFPRAHAAAYVTMAFRVAYYKVHFPAEFYAVYYTVRADDFDILRASGGQNAVRKSIRDIDRSLKGDKKQIEEQAGQTPDKLKKIRVILEIVYEMNLRGIELLNIDINNSEAVRFKVVDGNLLPPFNSVQGLGVNAAEQIREARIKKGSDFSSVDEFKTCTGASSAVMAKLEALNCFEGMNRSDQTSLFD